MRSRIIHLLLAVLLWVGRLHAQAPGDEDADCTGAENAPTYPDTVKNLMDSYTYLQLLPGNGTGNTPIQNAVWNDRSVDGNDATTTVNPTFWQQGAGGICRFQVRVCGWQRDGGQDNWLFTQRINQDFDPSIYNYSVEIKVEITYALQSCRERFGCEPRFTLHNYITNTIQLPSTSGSGFMNTQHYNSFAEVTPPDQFTHTDLFHFTLEPSGTGFYIAIRDNGTCVGISRLRVYRNNCQSFQSGLVLYPDAPAPVSGSANISMKCVNNGVVLGSPLVTCYSDGTWGPENPVCECRPGYEDRMTECITCPAGEYRSDNDVTCQQCPGNTKMDQVGVGQCECLDGYFRNDQQIGTLPEYALGFPSPANDQASTNCTQPPSTARDLTLTAQSRSITAHWSSPAQTGGRSDLYYQVEHSDPDNLGSYSGIYLKGSTSHTFTGLRPYTQYCIQVSAHNGVSDQDPDGDHLRRVEECIRTREGPSSAVGDLQCVYPVVLWQAPAEPNGVILDYQLNFTRDGGETKTETTVNPQTYFIITGDTLPGDSGGFVVQVRARNMAGLGELSCTLICDPERRSIEPQRCLFCPEQRVGLVDYPSTTAPETGTLTVTTQCVENAVESSPSLSVTCDSSGNWGNETPRCQCREGHTRVNQSGIEICLDSTIPPTDPPKCSDGYEVANSADGMICRPCEAGYFKSTDVDACTVCPSHSASDSPAASICHCTHHHYRLDDDTKNPYGSSVENNATACTKAPSKPTNLETSVSNTTISVSWEQPDSDGGRPHDVFYRVHLRAILHLKDPVEQNEIIYNTSLLSHMFRNLAPITQYLVTVRAENGVSYLHKRVEERMEQLEITTAEGNPEQVFDPKAPDNAVLAWGPPTVPNGVITGYEIMLTFCQTDMGGVTNETELLSPADVGVCQSRRYAVNSSTLFFVLDDDVLPDYEHNLTFTIRGKTGEDRYGVWSSPITIIPQSICPQLLQPTPSPTPPTCPPILPTECPSVTSDSSCALHDCIIFMGASVGIAFVVTTFIMCLFSCVIACLCHQHKMKTYKINMKKQMQSKWEY